jgi:hypothetical protein
MLSSLVMTSRLTIFEALWIKVSCEDAYAVRNYIGQVFNLSSLMCRLVYKESFYRLGAG